MAGFFSKLFGKNEEVPAQQAASPMSEAERKLEEIRNTVMDLQSKGRAIGADRERLRAEIRQKEQENQKLMDEYESLPDGLEKDMVMGTLEANEGVLDELRARVNGLNKSWGDNERVLQVMKRARERLQAAVSAGKSPAELALMIDEIARAANDADVQTGFLTDAAENLGGTSIDSSTSATREKVLARLAARKGAQAEGSSATAPATARPQVPSAEQPHRTLPAS